MTDVPTVSRARVSSLGRGLETNQCTLSNTTNFPPQWQVHQMNKGNQHWAQNITTQKNEQKMQTKHQQSFYRTITPCFPLNKILIPASLTTLVLVLHHATMCYTLKCPGTNLMIPDDSQMSPHLSRTGSKPKRETTWR